MLERRTSQGAWEFTDTDTAGNSFTRQFMGYSKREALKLFRQELRGYSLTFWVEKGVWLGRADFPVALGNTWEAREIIDRAHAALKRGIVRRIVARGDTPAPREATEVIKCDESSTGRIFSLTVSERVQTWAEVSRDLKQAIHNMKRGN